MPHSVPSSHQQQPDYIFVAVLCVCVLIVAAVGAGVMSLQRLLQPADSVLFGPTQNGESMFLVPTILISLLAAFRIAWTLAKWIRRGLKMPDKAPFIVAARAESIIDWLSINWRLVGGIAGVILVLVAAKGFGSYFYVTESGVAVRPPLEFSMRHYEWKDVTTVRVHCIHSIVKSRNRFRYILKMSDGYEVDLSNALSAITEKLRVAYAARFAESIPSSLNTVPNILYEFDVSEDGLALLGEKRGVVLPNAIREQVLAHGGTLQ